MKKLFLGLIAGVLMTGCTLPWDSSSSTPSGHNACVDTFMTSWNQSADVWDCLTISEQARLFYTNGWNDNAAMIKFLHRNQGDGYTYQVTYFAHNPVQVCSTDSNGKQTCATVYYVYVVPVGSDGTVYSFSGTGFQLTIVDGKIDNIG